ncbi:MAG: hypothetical protein ABR499_20345 [Gemmatimonadaceae bacterium]
MQSKLLLRCLLPASLAILAPPFARAQVAAITRDTASSSAMTPPGTWGAELGIGSGQSAILLRFRSPTSAVLLGAELFWVDVSEELPDVAGTRTDRSTTANITGRLGFRRYRGTAVGARPFTSVGVLAGYTSDRGAPGWTAGAFAELGASYFFSPHVSLGAVGGLQAIYGSASRPFNNEDFTRRQFLVRASAVQLLGAVYF